MAPKLKTCAKGIVENIVGEPRLGTPTAWPSKECMRPRGAAARAGGSGTAAGAVNMAPKLKTCAKGIVDSIVGNRVRERQPGAAWPNAGARPGMSSGTPSGHIVGSNVSGTARSGTSNVSNTARPRAQAQHRRERRREHLQVHRRDRGSSAWRASGDGCAVPYSHGCAPCTAFRLYT